MEKNYFKNLTGEERREIKEKIFRQLNLGDQAKIHRITSWKRFTTIAAAASLIAVAMLLVLRPAERAKGKQLLVAQTAAGEVKQLILADSSVVILNPSSSLYSTEGYSTGKREVFLEGNGFFKVKKMTAERSFIVHAGGQSITVLGTQFNVNTRKGNLDVVLTSGSVRVTDDNKKMEPGLMEPGDKLSYKSGNGEYHKIFIDPQLYSPWIGGEWKFRNTPLSEIAVIISEYYNVGVQFNEPAKKDLKMTAVFPVTDLETLLRVISETLPVTITNQQQQLIIQ